MRVTDFTTLTFDCYGTLIDWERGLLAELRPWVESHGLRLGDEEILAAFAGHEHLCEQDMPTTLYPDILAAVHRRLAAAWNIKASAEETVAFGRSVGRWPAFADTPASLQYLKRYYKLVILSNIDRASFAESNRKLGVSFDKIITAQDVGSYKPDTRNFEHLLRELAAMGIAQSQILHTAQSLYHDHAPAKACGLATLWVNRRKGLAGTGATPPAAVAPDFEVASLTEFVRLHQTHLRGEPA